MDRYFRLVDEGVEASFASHEVAFLSDLPRVLATLGDPVDDAGAARLSPPVYLGDPESDEEWRRLAGGELDASRRADRSAFEMVVGALAEENADPATVVISDEEAGAFMRVANEVRLVLGARWGIDGPDDYERLRPDAAAVLAFLGWVVSELAEVLGQLLDRR